MDYKTSFTIYHLGFFGGLALCVVGLLAGKGWLTIVGVVIGFLAMLQTALFYRCPKCKTLFTSKAKIPSRCPGCGYKLDSKK